MISDKKNFKIYAPLVVNSDSAMDGALPLTLHSDQLLLSCYKRHQVEYIIFFSHY